MEKQKFLGSNIFSSIYSYITRRNNIVPIQIYTQQSTTTNSGETVSNERSIAETTIFTCVNIIAQGIAQLPIESSSHQSVFDDPNDYQTSYEFIYSIIHSLLSYGNAFITIIKSGNGRVKNFVILDPSLISVSVNQANIPVYIYQSNIEKPISYDDIIHIKDVNTFDVQGVSRVALCAERIGCLKASDRQIAENFSRGIDIKYGIQSKHAMDPERKEEFSKAMSNFFGSEGAQRGGAILLEEGTITQLKGMTVADTDLREIRMMLIKEIASIFRVPSYMVGVDGDQRYSNVRQNQTSLYRDTYLPIIIGIQQAFEKKKINLEFNVDGLLRGDTESQMRIMTQAVQSGILTPNEARSYLGYEVMEDEFANQLNSSKTLGVADQRGSEMEPNAMNTEVTNNDGREEGEREQ